MGVSESLVWNNKVRNMMNRLVEDVVWYKVEIHYTLTSMHALYITSKMGRKS